VDQRFVAVCCVCWVSIWAARVRAAEPTTTSSPLTPKQTIEALVKATHNADPTAYRSVVRAEGELERQVLDTTSDLVAASAAFRNAAVKAYGEAEAAKYNLKAERAALPLEALPGLDNAEEKIDGDTAHVSDPGSSRSLELRRVNGKWKIPLSALVPSVKSKPELVRQNLNAMRGFASVLNETAGDVGKGHFRTAEEAAVILKLRLTRSHEQSGASDSPARARKDR
jgi:hypothetical protein